MTPPTAPVPTFVPGIDVSHFQQNINWPAVAASGIAFCFIKATDGDSLIDQRFSANWQQAKLAGIIRGAYHFFRPSIPVASQANFFLKTVQQLDPGDLPPVLDLEAPDAWSSIPVAQRASLALQWLQLVEQGLNRHPMVYLSPSFMTEVLQNAPALGGYPVWLAHYTSAPAPTIPAPWKTWNFWQHTGQGTAAGISTPVDLNWFNGTLDDLKLSA